MEFSSPHVTCATCLKPPVLVRAADGCRNVLVDACIADVVAALNTGGMLTVSSCCGHGSHPGSIALKGGRVLKLHPNLPV